MELVFASNNSNKLGEIRNLLPKGCTLLTLADIGCADELPETGNTIEANALQKARYLYDHYKVNCFADDSGLEIDSLNGEPGVHSAYYAGFGRNAIKNNELVLTKLSGNSNRIARFKTVIAYIHNGEQFLFEGILNGTIAYAEKGINGFGYDPIFIPDGLDRTLAELTAEEKNKISHRSKAVAKLVQHLTV